MASPKKRKKRDNRKKAARPRAAKKRLAANAAAAHRKPSLAGARKKKRPVGGQPALADMTSYQPQGVGARSGGQAGDTQALPGVEGAASESVEELLAEGNAYEAEVVKGVEDADRKEEREVETHEVPEDDVPEEYRERD